MTKNKLIISTAGSGKTTYIIENALMHSSDNILITTYTEANEAEIKRKIIKKKGYIPSNITIQTWFSFLLQHLVRPYQGSFNDILFENDVKGMILSEGQSGIKYSFRKNGKKINVIYKEDENFKEHYFTSNWKIYSDKISKFAYKSNKKVSNELINRLSKLYNRIYIDEVQDLAGYDLELIKLFFKSKSSVLLVGDPRQVTYLTHHSGKHSNYKNGRIKDFLQDNCKSLIKDDDSIDEDTLKYSHRNNSFICDFSSKLYPNFPKSESCNCDDCRKYQTEHEGIFLVRPNDVDDYLYNYNPVQLHWNKTINVNPNFETFTFGKSKGLTFNRVLIYPTDDMEKWIIDNNTELTDETRAKYYVAITRARYSVGIIYNQYHANLNTDGVKEYQ